MKHLRLAFVGLALAIVTACGAPGGADDSIAAVNTTLDREARAVTAGASVTLASGDEDLHTRSASLVSTARQMRG